MCVVRDRNLSRADSEARHAADDALLRNIIDLVPTASHPAVIEALKQDAIIRQKGQALPASVGRSTRVAACAKALATLWVLYCWVLPLSLLATAVVWVRCRLRGGVPAGVKTPQQKKLGTALITGGNKTKALHVCRHLSRAGWRVVLVDGTKNWSCCTRFSSSVSKFYVVPVPNEEPLQFLQAMAKIGVREKVALFVPVSIAQYSVYEALAGELLPRGCHSTSLPAPEVALLNDKIKFGQFAIERGLTTPAVFPVLSHNELRRLNSRVEVFNGQRYLLKSVHYAALNRADLFTLPCPPEELDHYVRDLEISELRPWLLQQFLCGPEFASYSILHHGRIVAHADNVAELSCLNYEHVNHPQILEWVEKYGANHKTSGQICFDFMLNKSDGKMYCIECNPRTSTNIVSFYRDDRLAKAFFDPEAVLQAGTAPLQDNAKAQQVMPLVRFLGNCEPPTSNRHVYWMMNEASVFLWRDLPAAHSAGALLHAVKNRLLFLASGADAVADPMDPLPFFALHFLQIPVQLLRIAAAGTPWSKIDWCSGKVVCAFGD